jgi:glycosyltransferase involved in cell wall biosynthesis
MAPLQILHVVRGLANSSGTTHIVGPLAEAQARLGHAVKVFFVDKPGRQPVLPDRSLVESHGFPMTVPTQHLGWSRAFARGFRAAVRNADVVHIHAIWNFPTWCAMRESHRAGVPFVVAPQGSLEDWALNRRRRVKRLYAALVERPYFNRAAAIQALTETEAAQCRQFGIEAPVTILPNGVDLSAIDGHAGVADLRAECSVPRDALAILFLSRLFPKKGLDLLIPAFARLAAVRPDVFLFIAGHDGGSGYRSAIERLATRHRAAHRIRFVGEVSGTRKIQILRSADLFVLPSYSEGLPIAALEAMACRCPVVLTRNCNLNDVEHRDAGWLVDPQVNSLFDALTRACASDAERRRRGNHGRRLVADRYTWERIAAESIRSYQSPQRTH